MDQGCFKINGSEELFKPSKFDISYDSISTDDSDRTDDGIMHITWASDIAKHLVKIDIEMPPCNAEDAHKILSLVQGQKYNITYFDIRENKEKTIEAFTSSSKGQCYNGVLTIENGVGIYRGLAFTATATGVEINE